MVETPRGSQHRGTCCLKQWSFWFLTPLTSPQVTRPVKPALKMITLEGLQSSLSHVFSLIGGLP